MVTLQPLRSRKKRPRVPEGVRVYAIGDIHGRVDLLDALLKKIDADLEQNPVSIGIEVYLGDYIDRGPASREVIERLISRNRTFRAVFLKGNHESYLAEFLTNPRLFESWKQLGGLETLISYGVMPSIEGRRLDQKKLALAFDNLFPASHRRFLTNLRLSFTCGDFFFVHAGIRPGVSLYKQSAEDLLWIRQDFLFCEDEYSKIIVHGHTPVSKPEICLNRINIDTGAYATGRLTCLKLEDDQIDFLYAIS